MDNKQLDIEQLLAEAKQDIFGKSPQCHIAVIGYNIAQKYFKDLFPDVEISRYTGGPLSPCLHGYLRSAFHYRHDIKESGLPHQALNTALECTDRFMARYKVVLDGLPKLVVPS